MKYFALTNTSAVSSALVSILEIILCIMLNVTINCVHINKNYKDITASIM